MINAIFQTILVTCFLCATLQPLAVFAQEDSADGKFAELTERELKAKLGEFVADAQNQSFNIEKCCSEILKRSESEESQLDWESCLAAQIKIMSESKYPSDGQDPEHGMPGEYFLLKIVTTLRRVQGESDPIQLTIKGLDEYEWSSEALPEFQVEINNVDSQYKSFGIFETRPSERPWPSRWKLLVMNEAGDSLETKPVEGAGQMVRPILISAGGGFSSSLKIADYIEALDAGKYSLRVQFHNTYPLGSIDASEDLIIHQSELVEFEIR